MRSSAPPTTFGLSADIRLNRLTAGLSSPLMLPATAPPPSHPCSPRKDRSSPHHHHRKHHRHQRYHLVDGLSQSSVSHLTPVLSNPSASSSASSSSSRSSVTARSPAGMAAARQSDDKDINIENNNSGNFPLLQSQPLARVKLYGTASEVSDDANAQSGHSATVIARLSAATTTTTTNTSANTTAIGSAINSPCPSEETPLSGNHVHNEASPVNNNIAGAIDAARRVNDLPLTAGKTQYNYPAIQARHTTYMECDTQPHNSSAVTPACAATGFKLYANGSQEAQRMYVDGHMPSYDLQGREATLTHAGVLYGDKTGNGGAFVDSGNDARDPSSSPKLEQMISNTTTTTADVGTRPGPPGSFGYTHLNTNDANENEGNANTDSGLFSPFPVNLPPTFSELVSHRIRTTSLLQFLWVLLLIVMLMVGNACQVIFLNFWIHQFPTKNKGSTCSSSASSASPQNNDLDRAEALESSYTTFVISATLFSGFFVVLFILYWLWRKPNLKFVREGAGWRLLLGIGAMDTLNSAMAIYAAAHTPEVLQALFVSLVPIYSAFFTKWLLKDPRSYTNMYVVVSFALIMAGVALASLYSYAASHQDHPSEESSGRGSFHADLFNSNIKQRGFAASHTPTFLLNFSADSAASAASRDRQIWCLIFFFSVPPTVLLNVWQTMYMIRYTKSDNMTIYLLAHEDESEDSTVRASITSRGEVRREGLPDIMVEGGERESEKSLAPSHNNSSHLNVAAPTCLAPAAPGNQQHSTAASSHSSSSSRSSGASDVVETSVEHQHRLHVPASELLLHGEDTTVKLVMLAADTTIQALLAFLLMPMDALPWFGGSDSIQEVWENLDEGVDCVLHCPHNLRYCLFYSMGFVLVYIAAAYLNRYSVTLCSMVSQLSGPITALVLIAFPKLNMAGDAAPWYVSISAVALLSFGTVIYVYWDETTGEEKARGEMQLKWAMMEEQARRQQRVDDGGEGRFPHAGSAYTRVGGAGNNASYSICPEFEHSTTPSHHRRSRTRRYRRRRQSSYVVVVDHDPDASRPPHPAAAAASDASAANPQ